MKPNFALNITDTAISLLHRTSRGWMEVGSAAFDSPDLEEALGYLRSSALGLSPQGITTKLILPPSQVLYLEVDAPGPDKAAREAQIRAALEGKTPYDVDDLVFDWWGTGPKVQVAVVARETLDEAEGFAETHRFNPVSFVTTPAEGQFAGEPWFGMATGAAALLPDGETLSRDQDPVNIITRDAPKPTPAPTMQDAGTDDQDVVAEAGAAIDDSGTIAEAEAEAARAAIAEAEAARAAKAEAARQAEMAAANAARAAAAAAAEAEARETASRAAEDAARERAEAAKAEMEIRAQNLAQAEAKRLVEEAEKAKASMQERERARASLIEAERLREADAARDDTAPDVTGPKEIGPNLTRPNLTRPEISVALLPEAPPPGAAPAFASRRRDLGPAAAPGPAPSTASAAPAAARQQPDPDPVPVKAAGPAAPVIPSIAPTKTTRAPAANPGAVKPLNGTPAFDQGARPQLAPGGKTAAGAMVTAARIPGKAAALSRFKSKVTAGAATPGPAPVRGDASMGKMGAKLATQRGKPRFLGLILTLILLAVLAGIAAWSSTMLSRDDSGTSPVRQAALPAAEGPPASDAVTIAKAPVAQAPVPEAPVAQPAPAPAQATATPPEVEAASQLEQTAGTDQITGPSLGPQDEIFLAGTDGQPPAFDIVALPAPQSRPDGAPDAAMPPPPFGTQYEFEADGSIRATPNGVVMPDGFWLIAAQPPVTPPARPAALTQATPPVEQPGAAPAAAAIATPPPSNPATASTAGLIEQEGRGPSSAFITDSTVENRRPRRAPEGRPASLDTAPAVADPVGTNPVAEDDASLMTPAPVVAQISGVRPRLRPQSVVTAAEQARKTAEAASLAATAAAAAAAEAAKPVEESLVLVAMSPRPAKRPQDFSRAVAAAVSAATRETERRAAVAPASTAAQRPARTPEPDSSAKSEEEEDEPELKVSAAPRIPTRANVASQATFKNAINLSKTNLIGVYGTDSKRYALIRTSSGRYNKVRVGDKVDGGTVAAITRNELRYKKGSKMLTLAMPNG